MRFFRRFVVVFLYPLRQVCSTEWAVARDVVGFSLSHLFEDWLTNLHSVLVKLFLNPVSTSMSAAALNGLDLGIRNLLEQLLGLLTHVLYTGMTGDVVGNLAETLGKLGL